MNDQPKWKQDFPISWGSDNYITRREFTKFLVLVSGATVVGNGYFVLKLAAPQSDAFHPVEIATIDEIKVGGLKLFRYPTENDPAILIRLAEDRFVAYLQRCTHLSCPVHYAASRGRLECPCHNGAFEAATGKVIQGPPPRPLPKIALRIEQGRVFAEGVQEG